jgi:methionyl aminopeptidase
MDNETRKKYIEAGKAVQEAKETARNACEPGTDFREIAREVEQAVRDAGAEPAFPVNLSRNDEAAHYTPGPGTERSLEAGDVLKVDIGAHVDGYIADTAVTLNPSGEHEDRIRENRRLLEKAVEFVEAGVTVGELGTHIQQEAPQDLNVIQNLTGHYLGRYVQHAGVSVPNVDNTSQHEFKPGDAVAIEPFLTDGAGQVRNGKPGNIYRLESDSGVRGRTQRKLLDRIKEYNGLPFASRWLDPSGRERMALQKMVQSGNLEHYDILTESRGGTVYQAEHTVLIEENGCTVTTGEI